MEVRDTDTDKVSDQLLDKQSIKIVFDSHSNSLLTISGLVVKAKTEVTISFGVRKILIPFEEYPNDPNRGFNIPHMPIQYTVEG